MFYEWNRPPQQRALGIGRGTAGCRANQNTRQPTIARSDTLSGTEVIVGPPLPTTEI